MQLYIRCAYNVCPKHTTGINLQSRIVSLIYFIEVTVGKKPPPHRSGKAQDDLLQNAILTNTFILTQS